MRFADGRRAAHEGLDPAWTRRGLRARFVAGRGDAPHHAAAGRHGEELGAYRARFVEPLRIAPALPSGPRTNAGSCACRRALGRAAAIVGRHRRRRDHLRPQHRRLSRAPRCAGHAVLDFPTGRRDRTPFFAARARGLPALLPAGEPRPGEPLGSYAGAMGMPQFMPQPAALRASTSTATATSTCVAQPGRCDRQRRRTTCPVRLAARRADALRRGRAPVEARPRAAAVVPDIPPSFATAEFAERGARSTRPGRAWDGNWR